MQWLDRLPLLPFGIVALLLALAPFSPQPHLIEKLGMLADGTLTRPLDLFDLLLHGTPALLFAVRLVREWRRRQVTGR
jgi:hypothetical protein